MERLHLVQFREARRCAGVRGAHCGVTANRNFLTQYRLIKRAGEGRKTKHRACLTNMTSPQKSLHLKYTVTQAYNAEFPGTPFFVL